MINMPLGDGKGPPWGSGPGTGQGRGKCGGSKRGQSSGSTGNKVEGLVGIIGTAIGLVTSVVKLISSKKQEEKK